MFRKVLIVLCMVMFFVSLNVFAKEYQKQEAIVLKIEKDTTKMTKKFIYFYFMKNDSEKIKQTVPSHINYWKEKELTDYLGGPFSDRTGGAITFTAKNIEDATEIILKDPFILNDILSNKWIKEWIAE